MIENILVVVLEVVTPRLGVLVPVLLEIGPILQLVSEVLCNKSNTR